MADGVDIGFQGESSVAFVHKRKGKVITQGYTENKPKYTKSVIVNVLNHEVTEDIIYRDGREREVKHFNNPAKFWNIKLKLSLRKLFRRGD